MKSLWLTRWLAMASLFASLGAARAGETQLPEIVDIHPDGTNVTVRVKVPNGTQRVTVEGRSRLKQGSWTPRGKSWLNGSGTETTVTFASNLGMELFRVSADDANSLPLPPAFYTGSTNFTPLVTASDPALTVSYSTAGPTGASADQFVGDRSATSVVESDIWSVDSNTVYFFNQYRGLQVIDVTQPATPVLKATLPLADAGEQMYVLSSTGPGNAWIALVTRPSCGFGDSSIVLVKVTDGVPSIQSRLPLDGSVVESRLIGNRLITASIKNNYYYGVVYFTAALTTIEPSTTVTSFDLTDPAHPGAAKSTAVTISASVVSATDKYFMLSGYGSDSQDTGFYSTYKVQVLDISDPESAPVGIGYAKTAGYVSDKFKLTATATALTVVSQVPSQWIYNSDPKGNGGTLQPTRAVVEAFSLTPSKNLKKLGSLDLVTNESLFGTRFSGDRLYVVTFRQIDPLWIVDLSSPTNLTVKGHLQVPGYSTFLQPLGDQLLTLGVLTNRVTASLFDVSDTSKPFLVSQATLGDGYSGTEANWNEKAFSVYPEAGLILLPWWGQRGTNQWFQGVQLLDLSTNGVATRGVIARDSTPRRVALTSPTNFVSITSQELFTADISDRDNPVIEGSASLLFHVDRVLVWGDALVELSATGTESYVQLAPSGLPEAPVSRVTLTNYPIVGASITGDTLVVLQRQSDNYRWEPINSTNPVVSRVPQPPLLSLETNEVVVLKPQPPIKVCTNFWKTIDVPPSPAGPGYTTNIWRTLCHDEPQPPLVETNTVVETVKTPQPDLLVTNWVVTVDYTNWVEYGSTRVTRIDLANSGLTEQGHWESLVTNFGGGNAKALWISTNVVVWAQENNWSYPLYYLDIMAPVSLNFFARPGFAAFPFYNGYGGRTLLAFNVNPSTPLFLGETTVKAPDNSTIGSFFEAEGKIYTGFQFSAPGGEKGTNAMDGFVIYTGFWAPWGNWETHYFLEVIDFGDPASPVIRDPIELPGALKGISHGGNLAYTLREGWYNYSGTTNDLTALAYDGLSVSKVDSLPLPNTPPIRVTATGAVYLARASSGTNSPATLETWAISTTGKFQRYSSVPSTLDIGQFDQFENLLVGSNGSSLSAFDVTSPLSPSPLGVHSEGCIWYSLSQSADGTVAGGLWIPRGDYGLLHPEFVPSGGN
ncbi:MAG TPA: beta-propeller domain-containing protein [Candidatus Limnocylindria bacterium]|jgi:hypothetical protein|nr:beta-propeller domain-containing protein [Candidatus Limnocylindria bacterium]